jgi:hypothetical protein
MAKLDPHHEWMRASVNAWQKEMTICQEAKEVYPKTMEINPEEMMYRCIRKSLWEAIVETFRALNRPYGDRYLAVRRRVQPKKRAQGNGDSGKNWQRPAKDVQPCHSCTA